MADFARFTLADAKLIARVVRQVIDEILPAKLAQYTRGARNNTRWIAAGRLTADLERGGKATFQIYNAAAIADEDAVGLEDEPADDAEYDLFDIGMLPETVEADAVVVAAWIGVWIIIAYDCGED